MDWAAWGPTIVSVITAIFFAGVIYSRQNVHSDKLREHDDHFEDHKKELDLIKSAANMQAVDIGMLKAWGNGWNAARATYEIKAPHHGGD
jgi:hypothetical protein